MAEHSGTLGALATLVGLVGGVIGIYKACGTAEMHKDRAEAAFVQAVDAKITITKPPPGYEDAPIVAPPTELHITVRNLGKHDATFVQATLPDDRFFMQYKTTATVLAPGEQTEFKWWVETRGTEKPWPRPPGKPRFKVQTLAWSAQQKGSISWRDRITKAVDRSEWCFEVSIISKDREPRGQTLSPCEPSPPR